ncbi:MAG: hypothetical protein RMY28_021920 [Nostoc sp. ChiSLP01]|nr:hypothetical protein [Nostoc sp. CmiSLP01]MDZ8284451.1 hypothetical protein [Nostoc sp. ChiSLP01]
MGRKKIFQSNLKNVTVRVESELICKIKLYSEAVGKSQTEILREFLVSAVDAIPDHHKQLMDTIAQCRASNWQATIDE